MNCATCGIKVEVQDGTDNETCENCSDCLTSIQNGKERLDKLGEEVLALEEQLLRKREEIKSTITSVLGETQKLERLTGNKIEQDTASSKDNFVRVVKKASAEISNILEDFEDNFGEDSSSTTFNSSSFVESEQFQVKTEPGDEDEDEEEASEQIFPNLEESEPVLEGVVKVEYQNDSSSEDVELITISSSESEETDEEDSDEDLSPTAQHEPEEPPLEDIPGSNKRPRSPESEDSSESEVEQPEEEMSSYRYLRAVISQGDVWLAEVTKLWDATKIHQHLLKIPKLTPEQFNNLVEWLNRKTLVDLLGKGGCFEDLVDIGEDTGVHANPPFHQVIKNCEVEEHTLRILAGSEFNFNCLNHSGRNVLYSAVEGRRSLKLFQRLNKFGVKVIQMVVEEEETLLQLAVRNDLPLETFKLLEEGLDITKKNSKGFTPLCTAIKMKIKAQIGHDLLTYVFLKSFKSGMRYVKVDEDQEAPILYLAALHASLRVVIQFLNNGAHVNEKFKGKTAFMNAICCRNLQKARHLAKNGADVHVLTEDGRSALHFAAEMGTFFAMEYCLDELGMDVNAGDGFGGTPLFSIILDKEFTPERQMTGINLLLKHGADLHARTSSGQGLLHLAASKGNIKALKFCLEKGLNVNAVDRNGTTPLECALAFQLPPGPSSVQNVRRQNEVLRRFKILLKSSGMKINSRTKEKVGTELEGRMKEAMRLNNYAQVEFYGKLLELLK